MDKHSGQIVEHTLRKQGYNLSDVAKSLSINRRSLYNWFNHAHLKPEIIHRIGTAIKYDFSKEFPELFSSDDFIRVTEKRYSDTNVADESSWKMKYIELLEQYNEVLLQKLSA